jgi:hypothetical protein
VSERDLLPAASGASMLASRCPVRRCPCLHGRATSSGEVGLYSREIAVVDAVRRGVSLKIAYARGPHFMGWCVSPAKALVANTIAQRGIPYDNHGGAAGRQ